MTQTKSVSQSQHLDRQPAAEVRAVRQMVETVRLLRLRYTEALPVTRACDDMETALRRLQTAIEEQHSLGSFMQSRIYDRHCPTCGTPDLLQADRGEGSA